MLEAELLEKVQLLVIAVVSFCGTIDLIFFLGGNYGSLSIPIDSVFVCTVHFHTLDSHLCSGVRVFGII